MKKFFALVVALVLSVSLLSSPSEAATKSFRQRNCYFGSLTQHCLTAAAQNYGTKGVKFVAWRTWGGPGPRCNFLDDNHAVGPVRLTVKDWATNRVLFRKWYKSTNCLDFRVGYNNRTRRPGGLYVQVYGKWHNTYTKDNWQTVGVHLQRKRYR